MSIALTALMASAASAGPVDPCAAFDQPAIQSAPNAPVLTGRLATLADIGQSNSQDGPSPFSISPDGKSIAFIVRRANPQTNSYCQRLMVAPLNGRGEVRELDRGGDFIRRVSALRNLAAVLTGSAKVITPRWSPDGQTIAYLKHTGSETQIWTVPSRGGSPERATNVAFEIEDFAWAAGGHGFVVSGRPQLSEAEAAIDAEATGGYLFDASFSPMMADRPFPVGTFPLRYFHVDRPDGEPLDASLDEIALLDPSNDPRRPRGAVHFTINPAGGMAWSEKRAPKALLSGLNLHVRWNGSPEMTCESDACSRIRRIWWSSTGEDLFILTRDGWAHSRTSLYRWRRTEMAPRSVLSTEDALVGCDLKNVELICAADAARTPRRLVAIDVRTGRRRTIFDPNPDFARLRSGEVRRLRFRNAFGVECYADLVLPVDARPDQKYPMVVVQYDSEGFLRGGTGDEVPIQALAGKGFAILSFQRPYDPPGTEGATSELDYRRRVRRDWIDRRSVESALEEGVRAAVATGMIDSERLGISGFSEGTSIAQWALINSRLFKVASLGVCCEDKVALPLNGGIGYEEYLREMDYPLFEDEDDRFWPPLSLAQNVDKIDVPILIQTSDDEYQAGLDVLGAFRRRAKPIEMYVFSGEPHIKWQPAHRLAMYDRVVDWFVFWLQAKKDCTSAKVAQYQRWEAMRGGSDLHAQCGTAAVADP